MAGEKGGLKKRGDFEVFDLFLQQQHQSARLNMMHKEIKDRQYLFSYTYYTVQVMFPVLQRIQHKQGLEPVGHYFLLILNPHNKQFEVLDSMRTLADETLRIHTCKTNSENTCMDGRGGGSLRPKLAFSVNFVYKQLSTNLSFPYQNCAWMHKRASGTSGSKIMV
ncbi:hypothetical protein U9M48_021350 [Paspalum notatum var. saurae]|uniref:Uncharacterized protein n=1 Tax=Paspalum notatum var. saurae TaxID=547442 RepID=A0AAQ3WSM2_PASNO